MQRRKFLIGMGSLAAGSAAAMGTGAFTSRADRAMSIDVVGSESAYLGVYPNTGSEYVSEDPLSIDLASDSGQGGSGVLQDAETVIRPAFQLKNQSSETLYIEIKNPLSNNDISTTSSTSAALGGGTVPAGLDVQFLSAPSLPLGDYDEEVALIGREDPVVDKGNGLGADFDEPASNEFHFHESGDLNERGGLTEEKNAGALEVEPGETFPVVLRVVARDIDAETGVPDVDFLIEAYDSSDPLTYETVGTSWA